MIQLNLILIFASLPPLREHVSSDCLDADIIDRLSRPTTNSNKNDQQANSKLLRTFDCPKCGAPVTYERSEMLGAQQPTIRCDYCHSTLLAPDELHGKPARVVPITIDLRSVTRGKATKWIWVLVAI